MEIRNRKFSNEPMESASKKSGGGRRGDRSQFLFKIFGYGIVVVSIVSILVLFDNRWMFFNNSHKISSLDRLSVALGVHHRIDAVVIDAGSTGSRILAFTFFRTGSDNTLKLDDELWHEVKPGLSSYVDDPKKGAKSLLPLLALAKERIPKNLWTSTPLVLKATAGLRLLPTEKATALLKEVENVLKESGFLTQYNSVDIMDGKDEGIFSWFTVNYLMDKIAGPSKETLVALDLGGGSTQITFVATEEQTFQSYPEEDFSVITLFNKRHHLYTHSYLGLGLMAGRAAVLSAYKNEKGISNCSCINPIINTEWTYGDKTFQVQGSSVPLFKTIKGIDGRLPEKRPMADYKDCLKTVINVISPVKAPKEIEDREVIAFSYFFDRISERGLIDPFKGGFVTVHKILQEANEICSIPNAEQPFACLDMTYIGAFLHYGYGIKLDTHIKLYKKIDNHEVSWALGLAFHVLNNGI